MPLGGGVAPLLLLYYLVKKKKTINNNYDITLSKMFTSNKWYFLVC